MTIVHKIAGPEIESVPLIADVAVAELLIKEARRQRRHRYELRLFVVASLILASIVSIEIVRRVGNVSSVTSTSGDRAIVVNATLPRGSRIWTLDMENSNSGFAVAGPSSLTLHDVLIMTTSAGTKWSVVSSLPYSFKAGEFKPLLHFVTPSIGYTQAFQVGSKWESNKIFVTTDGGRKWSRLAIAGTVPSAFNFTDSSTSPDFQFSSGVVSLVAEKCSAAQGSPSYGTCPATLADYHWGSTTPFASHKIDSGTWGSQVKFHTSYLLAAPSSKIALIADHAVSDGLYQLELTTNGGASWSRVRDPCVASKSAGSLSMSANTVGPDRIILNCSQGVGMMKGIIQLKTTSTLGRRWSTLNYSNPLRYQNGSLSGEFNQIWTSGGGHVMWSYSTVGFYQVTRNGGRTWSMITVNGVPDNSNSGGAPIEFDAVGVTGAYLVTDSGRVLRTTNGTNFRTLSLLSVK